MAKTRNTRDEQKAPYFVVGLHDMDKPTPYILDLFKKGLVVKRMGEWRIVLIDEQYP